MSTDTVMEFLAALDRDAGMRSQLGSVADGGNLQTHQLVEFASRRGFDFTPEELDAALGAHGSGDGEELSDDDLEAVAGGTGQPAPLRIGGRSFQNLGQGLGSGRGIVIING